MSRRPHSLVWKLFAGVWMCIILLISFVWLLNSFALPSYYRHTKQQSLYRAFTEIDRLYQTETESAVEEKLQRLRNNENIGTLIWQGNWALMDYRANGDRPIEHVPRLSNLSGGQYYIQTDADERLHTELLTLYGVLQNGYCVQIRISLSAIEESVNMTSRFLLVSGLAAILCSVGLVLVVARSFTVPIRALSRVADSVAHLDFSHAHDGSGSGEIDDLGNSINAMSAALSETISHLQEANRQLESDYALITKQNEARKTFIANVSHELKTPIALMQTYAEALQENVSADADTRRYYCEVIQDEALRMSEMIRRMTMLMQVESGTEQLETKRFDISALTTRLMLKEHPCYTDRKITLLPPPPEPVWVFGDRFLIENVLTNYLSNAFHHVNENGTVQAAILPTDHGTVRISIANTGNPIPADELSRIWESFYKVDKARTRAYGGAGIGLSVVAAIMRAHKMPYGVENTANGVAFFFELPAAPSN